MTFKHARYAPQGQGYELSSKGDKRFSALFAHLQDGRSIEQAYQLDVKGYRTISNDWRAGKGKPPLRDGDLWAQYLALWRLWAEQNPVLMEELRALACGKVLTDMFASSPVSQARALAEILNSTCSTAQAMPESAPKVLVEPDSASDEPAPYRTVWPTSRSLF